MTLEQTISSYIRAHRHNTSPERMGSDIMQTIRTHLEHNMCNSLEADYEKTKFKPVEIFNMIERDHMP